MYQVDEFICVGCNRSISDAYRQNRHTERGWFCTDCASIETCAACAELEQHCTWCPDVQNYICPGCLPQYKEVIDYIKPLNTPIKKAA